MILDRSISMIHGHWDHTGANHFLQEQTQAPLLIHEADAPMLSNAALSSATFFGAGVENSVPDRLLHDKDVIELGELKLEVLHTPGHSPGGVCLFTEDLCFSGQGTISNQRAVFKFLDNNQCQFAWKCF